MFGGLGAHLSHPHQLLPLELLKAEYSSCDYTNMRSMLIGELLGIAYPMKRSTMLDTLDIASSHLAVRLFVSFMNMSKAYIHTSSSL